MKVLKTIFPNPDYVIGPLMPKDYPDIFKKNARVPLPIIDFEEGLPEKLDESIDASR